MNKKILILADYYLPGFKAGGPIRALSNLIHFMAGDVNFSILTRDRDWGEKEVYSAREKERFLDKVSYLSNKQLTFSSIMREVKKQNPDLIYLNSFFSVKFSFKVILLKRFKKIDLPVILAPRGELSKGALSIKAKKKRFFLSLVKFLGLYKKIIWHVTCKEELEDVRREFGSKAQVKMAHDLIGSASKKPTVLLKEQGFLKLIFFSRISPKKNLKFALELLRESVGQIEFDIFGPIEDKAYWEKCLTEIKSLPENVVVNYCGVLQPERVFEVVSCYHGLFLPTLGENHGYVITESWQASRLSLISDQTPWHDLIKRGLGWDLSLDDRAAWQQALSDFLAMDDETFQKMTLSCQHFVETLQETDKLREQYKKLFGE